MRIEKISYFNNQLPKYKLYQTNPTNENSPETVNTTEKNNNSQYNNLSFGALIVKRATLSKSLFFDKFLKSNSNFLGFLKDTQMSPNAVFTFLCKATSNKDTAINFAKEVSSNPRKSESIKNFLIEKLGGDKNGERLFFTWFHDEEGGYRNAYGNYYNNEIWNKAKNLNSIIKESPIVAPWAFRSKAQELNIEPTLGTVPKGFENTSQFRILIKTLRRWNHDLQESIMEEKKIIKANATSDTMATSTKINELVSSKTAPFELEIGENKLYITPIVKSFSAKLIFFVDILDKEGKKTAESYVLKFPPHSIKSQDGDKIKKFNENQALRPDMPYLDAVVDFHLKENNSPNAPEIEFFDYHTQAVLYKKTAGQEPIIPEKYSDNLYAFIRYGKISDLKKLGIELSDVHSGNFLIDKLGNYRLIDSGHVRYSNTFRPPVIGKHISLGNLCGRELCK